MKHKISAVLIAYNEADIIERTLQALTWCNEIVVVDSGSTDTSMAIYEKYNCRVFKRTFDGYGTQKDFAFSQAQHDWILSIDADEVISDALKKEIQDKFSQDTILEKGFYLPRTLIFLNTTINSEKKQPCLRLFHKAFGSVSLDKVHEKISVEGKLGKFKHQLWHYSYRNLNDYFTKFNRYTSLAAEERFKKGKSASKLMSIARFFSSFFKFYILKGCIANGFAGFVWSLISSVYHLIKYVKLIELYEKKNQMMR